MPNKHGKYKDVQRVAADGKRVPGQWARLPLEKVDNWVKSAKAANSQHVFTTIQTFFIPEHRDGEEAESGLYADFDGESALDDVRKAALYFVGMGVHESYIRLWFSGNKGFHLVIPREIFGALPHPDAHKIWRRVAKAACENLKSWDQSVYSSRRMWRVENTLHGSSRLYKIPLTLEDVQHQSLGEIRALASKEQVPHYEDYEGPPVAKAQELYQRCVSKVDKEDEVGSWEQADVIFDEAPACIAYLLENGVLELGTKNMTMFRLAAYFKSQEYSKGETINVLKAWAQNISPACTHELTNDGQVDMRSIHQEIQSVCNSVFGSDRYGFSCQGILQIPGLEELDLCTDDCRAEVEGEIELALFDLKRAEYKGKRWSCKAEVVGRRDESYTIPESITAWCDHPKATDKCPGCPLYGEERVTKRLTARTKNILSFIEPSSVPLMGKVGNALALPKRNSCSEWKFSAKERDVEVIYLAPRIANESTEVKEAEVEDGEGEYTRSLAYYFGYGLKPNQSYKLSGYTHTNVRTNQDKLVIDKAEPLSDTLTEFIFTAEMQRQSEIFRPGSDESIEEKHNDIIAAINRNHIRLWNRDDLIRAIDLCYHSVNKFWFQEELVPGWLDILIIGDTRQGKSKTSKGLMGHYDLGIRVGGESATRTGLLWTIPTKENEPFYIVWGVMPRYHRRLVIVDEIKTLIETKGFAELTDARSDGQISVTKAVFGKAACETRVVWMTNTTGRRRMGNYQYPVTAIPDLIPDYEDISRFTFAVGVASGEVPDHEINRPISDIDAVEDKYSTEVCHNHILWAWKLKPEDIIIKENVQKYILLLANNMCRKYTQQIPLVEPGDFKLKLARTACAVAARMYQRQGNKLVVTEHCAEYAYNFIDRLYSGSPLRYDEYSRDYHKFTYTDEGIANLIRVFRSLLDHHNLDTKIVAGWLSSRTYIRSSEVSAVLDSDPKDIRVVLNWCSGNHLVEPAARGAYTKTEQGVKFLRALLAEVDKEKNLLEPGT